VLNGLIAFALEKYFLMTKGMVKADFEPFSTFHLVLRIIMGFFAVFAFFCYIG
jgi:hypothetical protein